MKKKEFKSESKKLLDLMINSIYTNREIFLRELISNASDALDKLYYKSLTDANIKVNKDDLKINISVDKENNTLIIEDNGIGMSEEELESNLGTIAKSGSLVFKEMNESNKDIDIIGKFGVGFYSAFMVSDKVDVLSKSIDSDKAYLWESEGADGYTITEASKETNGTIIRLHLKKDTEDDKYSEYLDEYKIKELVKKYSDYVRYPIIMEVHTSKPKKDNEKEYENVVENETLNSMVPIWKKDKKDIKEDEYDNYYIDKYYDYEKPLKVITTSVEGMCSYKGLLFIPSHAPYDFYTKEYEKGLSLYSNGILIMDKCKELLPDYFSFVKGVIDSEDISLNISREMLQRSKNFNIIAKNIENKIKKELELMIENDKDNYKKFFKAFGNQLKFGIYNEFGAHKDELKDLIMFYSSREKDLISLKDYVKNMVEGQDSIYYACGETNEKIDLMPQTEQVKGKDYDILYLTDYIDEFVLSVLNEYDGHKFVNVANENLNLESSPELEKFNEENKDLLNAMKDAISISDVKFTNKLKNHSVCLTTKGDVSVEMEKVINAMPTDERINAEKVLEINMNHPITNKLKDLYENDKEELKSYAKVLYAEARLIEGLSIENPTEISNLINAIISK